MNSSWCGMSSSSILTCKDLDIYNDHHVRGFQPLDEITKLKFKQELTAITLCKDECINDAVIYTLSEHKDLSVGKVKIIDLSACTYITDLGIKYLCKIVKKCPLLEVLNLSLLPNITHHSIHLLAEVCPSKCRVNLNSSGLHYLPASDLNVSTQGAACLNSHPNKAKLGRRFLIVRESSLDQQISHEFHAGKSAAKSLHICPEAGATEIVHTHTWLERFIKRPWPQIVVAFGANLPHADAIRFVYSTIGLVLANQPPFHKSHSGPKFIVVCMGGSDDAKKAIDAVKNADLKKELGLGFVTNVVKHWKSKSDKCDQTSQVQYSLALKLQDSLDHIESNSKNLIKFIAHKPSSNGDLQEFVKKNDKADQEQNPFFYTRSELTDALVESLKGNAEKHVVKASSLPDQGASKTAELQRLQDLGHCIYLGIGDMSLVVTNVPWFLDVLTTIEQRRTSVDAGLVPSCAGHSGCTDRDFYSILKLDEKIPDLEVRRYLLNILDLIGPAVKVACERSEDDQPGFYLLNTVNMKPPVPLEHYYEKDRKKQTHLLSRRVTFHLSRSVQPATIIHIQALIGNFSKFESLWSHGYVSHSGAVEIIAFIDDNRSELLVEGLLMAPPQPISGQDSAYVRRHLWSVVNVHTDVIEYVLRSSCILYNMDRPDNATNYSICAHHVWEQPEQSASEIQKRVTVCTLCQNCTNSGRFCAYNGLRSNLQSVRFRQCGCQTAVTGCWECGICRRCVRLMWAIKSSIRPCQGNWQEYTYRQNNMFLLPSTLNVGFDEVTLTTDVDSGPYLSLHHVENRETIQIFPGLPKRLQKGTHETVNLKSFVGEQIWRAGDCLRVKLTFHQPSDLVAKGAEANKLYNTHILRRMSLWQQEGILCYTASVRDAPVGLCASKLPMTKKHNCFAIKILDKGARGMITLGIVPKHYSDDSQPGWREKSVAFHGDDGGFYLSAGRHRSTWKRWKEGDIIECGVDFNDDETKSVYFCYNGEKKYAITGTDRLPDEFYAAVGMHSPAEQCQILYSSVWRASDEAADIDPTKFKDNDTVNIAGVLVSPAVSLTLEQTSTGWKDKKGACIFIKNTTQEKKAVTVNISSSSTEKLFDVGMRKNCKVGQEASVMGPGEMTVALLVKSTNSDPAKDGSDAVFTIRWLEASTDDEVLAFIQDPSKTDPNKTHRLRYQVGGAASKTNQGIQARTGGAPSADSHRLEIFKNGLMITDYWIPKNNYHLQMVYPEFSEENYRDIPVLVQMPKLPTFDLPEDFLPGMILELRNKTSGDYEAGVVKQIRDDGRLVIEPKYRPDPDKTYESVEVARTSQDIRPVARAFQNIRFLMGVEPSDLWNVAFGTLFTDKQVTTEMRAHLWMFCSRRGTRCVACPWLITAQEANVLYQSAEAFLPRVMTSLELIKLSVPLPRALSRDEASYPAAARTMNGLEMNLHPICYPGRIQQLRSELHLTSSAVTPLVPHLLDGQGFPIVPEKNDLDFIWRRSLNIAWAYLTMGTNEIYLEPSKLVTGCEKDFDRVCRGLRSLLYQYACLSCLFTPARTLADRAGSKTPLYGAWEQLRGSYVPIAHQAVGKPDKLITIHLETIQERICAAHFYASDMAPAWKYKLELVQPYEKLLSIVAMNAKDQRTLPDDWFPNLINVEMLAIVEGNELTSLPDSLDQCRKLKQLIVRDTVLTNVPKSLNVAQLSSLSLVSCRLRKVPEAVCDMVQLKALDLSYNEISDLPACFTNLQNLTSLALNGVPWFQHTENVRGNAGAMVAKDWYTKVEHSLKQNRKILGEQEMDRLWARSDLDSNSMLDSTETPDLNAQLFYLVSRFGLDYEDGDEDGGFPLEICELTKLERLHLTNHAIRFIPKQIGNLVNLKSLALDNNPLLESLPASFYQLKPSLIKIRLQQCPSLKTPPIEVASRGMDAIFAYLKYLSADFTECRRTKLMLVGLGGAGKTSLLRALMSGQHKTKPTVGEDITNGIDIGTWTVKGDDGTPVSFSTWDFAGQTVYYNTHQFFLSKRAVYLLLWTTRLGFEHAGLEFWLSSISCHAPKTPIFIVGTHCDQVPKADVPEKELKERYPQIAGFRFVSSISGQGVADLEKALTEVALQQSYMGEQIPGIWLELEQKITENRANTRVMKYEDVSKLALEVGIFVENDIKEAISFLHDLGTIQFFDSEFLRDNVVIDPQWIVDVMSSVVSVKDSPIKDGLFYHSDIDKVWTGDDQKDLHDWLLRLTEKFDLTFPLPDKAANIVPCLLPQNEPEIRWPDVIDPNVRENKIIYRFTYLPAGLFNRAQVRLFEFSSSEGIWKHGSLLKKNGHLALVRQMGDRELVVKVQGPQPQNVCFLVHEVFENLIRESFNGVHYELFLPCPDCAVQESTREPDLFPASLIHYAINRKAPYLQCRKYFHTISMSELQGIVPPDSGSDFDAQMNRSVHMLRSLRQELSTDIFMSFCDKDIPDPKLGITPGMIRADLEKAGYNIWYPEEQKSAQELAICLSDSKLMLVFMSNEYDGDETLRDLFLYCRNVLKKPYVVINYSDDSRWLKAESAGSSLGMIIGAQELYVRMTKLDQYPARFNELKSAISKKMVNTDSDEQPVCFLSYCWTNSAAATSDSARRNEAAQGPVDPRELKDFLTKNGISCWIDVEQTGQKGLFEDICEGVKGADFMVACISDQYTNSENCMMELRFATYTLKKPVIFVIVGNSPELEPGEISMMRVRNYQRNHTVYMHERSQAAFDRLLQLAHNLKLDPAMRKRERPRSTKPHSKIRNIAFKEEYELLQRKFIRQIAVYKNEIPIPYPKLVVLDFSDEYKPAEKEQCPTRRLLTKRTSTLDEESEMTENVVKTDKDTEAETAGDGDWRTADMCFRILCECEEGWHACGPEITYSTTRLLRMTLLTSAAPYLYRMYTVLKQSGVRLNCLNGEKGAKYMDFIREAIGSSTADNEFSRSYITTLETTMKHDPGRTMGDLDRCYLPSGKIRWLCPEHQSANKRITVLSRDLAVSANAQQLVTDYDFLVRERILGHSQMAQFWLAKRTKNKGKVASRPKTGTSRVLSQAAIAPIGARNPYPSTQVPRQNQPTSQACSVQ